MFFRVFTACFCMGILLAGCMRWAPVAEADYIPAASIINGVKCELAKYMRNRQEASFVLEHWVIGGSLELQIVDDVGSKAGVSADSILALQPVSLNLGLSGEISEKRTRRAVVEFKLDNSTIGTRCPEDKAGEFYFLADDNSVDKRYVVQGIGMERWLHSLDYVRSEHGPSYKPSKYSYGLTFAVARQSNLEGGAKLAVVPVSLSASTYSKREDVQILTMAIEPKKKPEKADPLEVRILSGQPPEAKGVPQADLKGFLQRGPASVEIREPRSRGSSAPSGLSEQTQRELSVTRDRLFTQ